MNIFVNFRKKSISTILKNFEKIQKELDNIISIIALFPKSQSDQFLKNSTIDRTMIESILFELKRKKELLLFNKKLVNLLFYHFSEILFDKTTFNFKNKVTEKENFENLNNIVFQTTFLSNTKIEDFFNLNNKSQIQYHQLIFLIDDSISKIEQIEEYLQFFLNINKIKTQKANPVIEYRQTRLIPRSIPRTIERFFDELNLTAEDRYIQEFQLSRQQIWISFRALVIFLFFPIFFTHLLKGIFLEPMISYSWNKYNSDFFLNHQQEQKALNDLKNFEDKIYFEQLVQFFNNSDDFISKQSNINSFNSSLITESKDNKQIQTFFSNTRTFPNSVIEGDFGPEMKNVHIDSQNLEITQNKKIETEMLLIAKSYNQQSITLLSNLIGDIFTVGIFIILFNIYRREISILKAFLSEILYSLGDTTKSFFIILLTDLLVGFHSPKGWEIFIESILNHFAIPQNEDFVFLCVATFPVLLDTAFKYWIFRYLNRLSPSTVVTYHKMIE